MTGTSHHEATPTLSRAVLLSIFVVVLLSYCIQTEVTMLVQRTYRKPFLLLWVTHSGYTWIAPLHLLTMRLLRMPYRPLLQELRHVLEQQLASLRRTWRIQVGEDAALVPQPIGRDDAVSRWLGFPARPALRLLAVVTALITVPALCWYCAVALTLPSEVPNSLPASLHIHSRGLTYAALYNSAAIWAYVISVLIVGSERWEVRKSSAVGLATLGVLAIVYGDASRREPPSEHHANLGLGTRLIGSILALAGAVFYAVYEVYYSRFIAMPPHISIPLQDTKYDPVLFDRAAERTSVDNGHVEQSREEEDIELASPIVAEPAGVPPAVLLAHANSITFAMGALTFAVGWLAFPVLHFTGLETFELPPDWTTAMLISLIVLGGVGYNAGFMILLSQWGPIVASVGNLCTLVLVALLDFMLGAGLPTVPTLIGGALIIGAFVSLALDSLRS